MWKVHRQESKAKEYRRSSVWNTNDWELFAVWSWTVIPNIKGEFHIFKIRVEHYDDVIMTTIASQITSLTSVYSTVYSDADQRKHQSSASLAFVRGIHRVPHKGSVTRKMFPFDDVIMGILTYWSRMTHICVSKLKIIGSDNGLSHGRCQAIIWTNAGILLIGPLGTNFSEILIAVYNEILSTLMTSKICQTPDWITKGLYWKLWRYISYESLL